jgi:hypothetical protein
LIHENPPKSGASPSRHQRQGAPAEYKVIPEKRLVWVKFGKIVSESEIASYAAGLRSNPLFEPKFSEIVDLRDVEHLDLHGEQMLKLADEVDPFSFDSRRAFVVRNATQSHAARMHQILRIANENLRICYSVAEAEQWIESRRA